MTLKKLRSESSIIHEGKATIRCDFLGAGRDLPSTITYFSSRGDQEGLFELVILNFISKCYNWSTFAS
jgi:hypothetical protein